MRCVLANDNTKQNIRTTYALNNIYTRFTYVLTLLHLGRILCSIYFLVVNRLLTILKHIQCTMS